MASTTIWHQEDGKNYTFTVDIGGGLLSSTQVSTEEYYLLVSTSMKKADGTSWGKILIKDHTNVAPGNATASTWTEQMEEWCWV